jgi:hypothetical protein
MTMNVNVTIELPAELVQKAEAAGILTAERMAELVERELERQSRTNRFFETVDQLTMLEPPLTEDEINAEIAAYRREKGARST